jgi:signal transduction histidine kinase
MSGLFPLDWATLSVSLFNTILLLWLGLTVLLNAERRAWGIWLAGGGLLAGAAFFVSHSILLSLNLTLLSRSLEFWWRAGWAPLIALPFAWYTLTLWYTGAWQSSPDTEEAPIRRGHRIGWYLATTLTLAMIALLLLSGWLPSYGQLVRFDLTAIPTVGEVPLLIAAYPLYALLCIGLSLSALASPAPSPRFMGDLARQRARPWFIATAVALALASLLVAAAMGWLVLQLQGQSTPDVRHLTDGVAWFDLVVSTCLAAAIVSLGQAIISYEIFTGHQLPRRGFLRHWRRAVILAAGYSLVVGWSLAAELRSIYGLLLTVVIMTAFYAMLVWRSFGDRERALAQLRPFVSSQGLYDHLRQGEGTSEVEAASIFHALCEEVLGASRAQLIPLGASTPLVGPPLVHPQGREAAGVQLGELVEEISASSGPYLSLDAEDDGGGTWVIPLRHEGGLMGVLLLGGKRGGGLYTQEEMELAQAGAERLLDIQASAELARRLMDLQRQKLAETQIVDQRTRRTLHDELLPRLHAALLALGGDASEGTEEATALLAESHHLVADLLRDMPAATTSEVERWGVVRALSRAVNGELAGRFDAVKWDVKRDAEARLRHLPPLHAEVLFYAAREAIRNAAHHGQSSRGGRTLNLEVIFDVEAEAQELAVQIRDTGPGMPSTDDGPERGQGLALHSTMMAVIGGTLEIASSPGAGTRVLLRTPTSSPGTRSS